MQVLWGLQQLGYKFQLKGGTSLSKGHKIIDRFSEDLDILIEPPAQLGFTVNPNSLKDNAAKTRKDFYDWLSINIEIDGIEKTARDEDFDDKMYYRSGGIRLFYKSYFGSLPGVKDGILLEVGFSKVTPNVPIVISSWAYDFAIIEAPGVITIDNRAIDVPCYLPGYTLVEKLQTIVRNYRQEVSGDLKSKNYMRQYYDVYNLLGQKEIQDFIISEEYQTHKANWIKGKDAEIPLNDHPALKLDNLELVKDFSARYLSTSNLYYRGQVPFEQIVTRIRKFLPLL